jgi:hypothetical protein
VSQKIESTSEARFLTFCSIMSRLKLHTVKIMSKHISYCVGISLFCENRNWDNSYLGLSSFDELTMVLSSNLNA